MDSSGSSAYTPQNCVRLSERVYLGTRSLRMKTRTAILVICIAVISVNVSWAQTVEYDRAGNKYTCRAPAAGSIYDKESPTVHKYDIAKAKQAAEGHPADHDSICIDSLALHRIKWSWSGAHHVAVRFFPMTNDWSTGGECWTSKDPFTGTPAHSGNTNTLQSGEANKKYQWCAYKLQFDSSAGSYDPHIIITGDRSFLLRKLEDKVKSLQNLHQTEAKN